jgi:hypothetical protein
MKMNAGRVELYPGGVVFTVSPHSPLTSINQVLLGESSPPKEEKASRFQDDMKEKNC